MFIRIGKLCNYPSCLETVAGWAHELWYKPRGVSYQAVFSDFEKRMNRDSLPMTFVALDGAKPCGMVSLKHKDLLNRMDLSPWLSSLYVLPEYRRRGIGRSLVHIVLKEAALKGYKRIYLFSDHRDAEHLNSYYTALGWKLFAEDKDSFGNSVKIFVFKL